MSLAAYYAAIAASGGGSVIDSLTLAVNISAAVPADYTDAGAGAISAWGPYAQATPADRPLLVADVLSSGLPGIQFAVGDKMTATVKQLSWDDDWTLFLALTPEDSTTFGNPFYTSASSNRTPFSISVDARVATNPVNFIYRIAAGGGSITQALDQYGGGGNLAIVSLSFDSSAGTLYWDMPAGSGSVTFAGLFADDAGLETLFPTIFAGTYFFHRLGYGSTFYDAGTLAQITDELVAEWPGL